MEGVRPGLVTPEVLKDIKVDGELSLFDLSQEKTVLLVFLRHFGCIFCRQALKEIEEQKEFFKENNTEVVFAHMADMDAANEYFNEFGLSGVKSISDPETKIYALFGLVKGSFSQLYGLSVWAKGIKASVEDKVSFSTKQIGDSFQMPGIFVIHKGEFQYSYYHRKISDKPDYSQVVSCCKN